MSSNQFFKNLFNLISDGVTETEEFRIIKSQYYNTFFNKKTGFFLRFGETMDHDPKYAPAPEIADIEISTICHGVDGIGPCRFCYKANTGKGKHMSLETFKKLLAKIKTPFLSQIAFGIGDINASDDLWKIMEHTRKEGIVPNITINGEGITYDIAEKLAKLCGAVAVSIYDKEKSYDAVEKLATYKDLPDYPLKQINIHYMISNETYYGAITTMSDIINDKRLSNLNALVFLSVKPKGRAESAYTPLSQNDFNSLIEYATKNNISWGSDSCGAVKAINALKHMKMDENLEFVEPCESSLFSSYFNVDGMYYPCSFLEGNEGIEGIDIINEDIDITKMWHDARVTTFRKNLLSVRGCRGCPVYNI